MALELRPDARLDLARRLVGGMVPPDSLADGLTEGIRRIEDITTGRVKGLAEEEYRAALQ